MWDFQWCGLPNMSEYLPHKDDFKWWCSFHGKNPLIEKQILTNPIRTTPEMIDQQVSGPYTTIRTNLDKFSKFLKLNDEAVLGGFPYNHHHLGWRSPGVFLSRNYSDWFMTMAYLFHNPYKFKYQVSHKKKLHTFHHTIESLPFFPVFFSARIAVLIAPHIFTRHKSSPHVLIHHCLPSARAPGTRDVKVGDLEMWVELILGQIPAVFAGQKSYSMNKKYEGQTGYILCIV